jgi:hypothetical protein
MTRGSLHSQTGRAKPHPYLFYKYKTNMIAEETVSDPLKDDSFRKFVRQEEFIKAVRENAEVRRMAQWR